MKEHGFSVRLKSKDQIINISIPEKNGEAVLIEGILGDIEKVEIIENAVLLITGTKGTLMVDLSEEDLRMRQGRQELL